MIENGFFNSEKSLSDENFSFSWKKKLFLNPRSDDSFNGFFYFLRIFWSYSHPLISTFRKTISYWPCINFATTQREFESQRNWKKNQSTQNEVFWEFAWKTFHLKFWVSRLKRSSARTKTAVSRGRDDIFQKEFH